MSTAEDSFFFLARLLASFMGGKNIVARGGVGVPFAKLSLEEEERVFFAQAEDSEIFFLCYGASAQDREEEERDRGYYYLSSSSSFEDAEI